MNKSLFRICRGFGHVCEGLAVTCALLIMCIDIEFCTTWEFFKYSFTYGVMVIIFGFIGYLLNDMTRVGRVVHPTLVVLGAYMYSKLNMKSIKFCKRCYSIYRKCKTYRRTYQMCQDVYDTFSLEEYSQVS